MKLFGDKRNIIKTIGPGLLFASSSIGTSHLVLSTRAGAHHGLIFAWIILAALVIKYPFFEYGPRYSLATGNSIIKGYRDQGRWAVVLFFLVVVVSMFAVVGAVSAVSGGLLGALFRVSDVSVPSLVALLMVVTAGFLIIGKYRKLDQFVKLISIVLLVTVCTAFVAVLHKGPVAQLSDISAAAPLLEGAGLALLVGLVGWMPSGMTASVLNSIWVVEKIRSSGYRPTLKEGMFDFRLGYGFTAVLAFMFLVIGALTVYGSGQLLEGGSSEFSQKLINVFTINLGEWTYPVISLAAFATIYGTLITAWDAFARGCSRSVSWLGIYDFATEENRLNFVNRSYPIVLILVGVGGFILFTLFTSGMIAILEAATILSFLVAPIISFLNLRAITSNNIPEEFQPSRAKVNYSYFCLIALSIFAMYYIFHIMQHGGGH